ncbi:ubiquitin-conjugating enzyme/RWD-like protein, partial [Tricharina praecox]|uniref:ubiquitin-conjugating enzyme/RWD-like protein n=1 Tax=Tricharina praecox TaxID=43433 RepID=UPI00221E7AD4
ASQRRRLAQDHAMISNTPPSDYFFAGDSSDDLTGLSIYLVGPTGTPFESGVFHISLRIPPTYPQDPPKANFTTKIFHPNVDGRTGDVCVDTLKRDWNPKLTLHDVLVTIRCLLVFPNPTSSLNEAAGKLLLDDYEAFARHARLMTEVHAAIPEKLKKDVEETRLRDGAGSDGDALPLPSSPKKLVASSSGSNTALKQTKHKRKPSKSTSDSDGGDSGKENVVTAR